MTLIKIMTLQYTYIFKTTHVPQQKHTHKIQVITAAHKLNTAVAPFQVSASPRAVVWAMRLQFCAHFLFIFFYLPWQAVAFLWCTAHAIHIHDLYVYVDDATAILCYICSYAHAPSLNLDFEMRFCAVCTNLQSEN